VDREDRRDRRLAAAIGNDLHIAVVLDDGGARVRRAQVYSDDVPLQRFPPTTPPLVAPCSLRRQVTVTMPVFWGRRGRALPGRSRRRPRRTRCPRPATPARTS